MCKYMNLNWLVSRRKSGISNLVSFDSWCYWCDTYSSHSTFDFRWWTRWKIDFETKTLFHLLKVRLDVRESEKSRTVGNGRFRRGVRYRFWRRKHRGGIHGTTNILHLLEKRTEGKVFFIFQAYHGMPRKACEGEFSGVRVNGSWHGWISVQELRHKQSFYMVPKSTSTELSAEVNI